MNPYILYEQSNLTEIINLPLKSAQRIKYTCFDVSNELIVFGATSGGIYIFTNGNQCEFMQLIPNKDGPIQCISISPASDHIAFANAKGIVSIVRVTNGLETSVRCTSKEHQGSEITCLVWGVNCRLFIGDDMGKVSILQASKFNMKAIFHDPAQVIMNLDSKVCQIDVKYDMLLVSTMTKTFICDTEREQYRQIGQKLRQGLFGACFLSKTKDSFDEKIENDIEMPQIHEFNISDDIFAVDERLKDTLVFCARPSSRLWEVTVEGSVKSTHQFKCCLNKPPDKMFNKVVDSIMDISEKSIHFEKIYSIKNCYIFTFKRNGLYFLNVLNPEYTLWFNCYNDVVECKVVGSLIYIWLMDASFICLNFIRYDKFALKAYLDEDYMTCAKICTLYENTFLESDCLNPKLFIISDLNEKLDEPSVNVDVLCEKFAQLKQNAVVSDTGIYTVDNAYRAQTMLEDSNGDDVRTGNKSIDPIQTIRDIKETVSDRLNISKKLLKEKWDHLEVKVKGIANEQLNDSELSDERIIEKVNRFESLDILNDGDDSIVASNNNNKVQIGEQSNDNRNYEIAKEIYTKYKIELINGNDQIMKSIEPFCDEYDIYEILKYLKDYCLDIDLSMEEASYIASHIFLIYVDIKNLDSFVIDNEFCAYFIDSCITVNNYDKSLKILCDCKYPLPLVSIDNDMLFSELIEKFIEKVWLEHDNGECFEMCKQIPNFWRNLIYLRRNEDLQNILEILLQILDEKLLNRYLPQFTNDIWRKAIQLYSTLNSNACLKCGKKFSNINVKDSVSWDDFGKMMLKSIGSKALRLLNEYSDLITGLTMKFYHTSLLAAKYEKYDFNFITKLVDTLYDAYLYDDSRKEIIKLLQVLFQTDVNNTSLPLVITSKSNSWSTNYYNTDYNQLLETLYQSRIICNLCNLPLINEALMRAGLWCFICGHLFHGVCLDVIGVQMCPSCTSVH